MSMLDVVLQDKNAKEVQDVNESLKLEVDKQLGVKNVLSAYSPTEPEKLIRGMILRHFALGYNNMYTPRVEFSDLSTFARDQVDFLAFNVYQPNNGEPNDANIIGAWRSNAIRPIERNKTISIAAHTTARLVFPKVFAYDNNSEVQQDAAQVIQDLMEWAAEQSNYSYSSLQAVIQALVAPAGIVHTEYSEVYRDVKRERNPDGSWKTERILDETMSGFKDTIVPVDQLYIENFFEHDVQKQGWMIWRRVQNYSLLEEKYKDAPNWQYVKPGMHVVYNDANSGFYYVYDPNMRQFLGEEILYWNKSMDVFIVMVNGVMLTAHDNPNPRQDKLFPFAKFGYEFINSRCFYYKSLVYKISHDASIINTLYPMIMDGTYLSIFKPMINRGGEAIGSDVMVPGSVTTLSDPDATLQPIDTSIDLKSGMDAMFKVEESVNASAEIPVAPDKGGDQTAYEISKREQERNTVLGLFVKMIESYVRQYGELRLGDILQHLTIADVDKITDDPELVYKTFLLHNKKSGGKNKHRKIQFDGTMSIEPMTAKEKEDLSFDTLEKQGGDETNVELFRVNPELIRDLKYMLIVSPDVMNPMSEELERAFMLEEYDRAINTPLAEQEAVYKDFLLGAYPKSAKDPDKYVKKQQPEGMQGLPGMGQAAGPQQPPQGGAPTSPVQSLMQGASSQGAMK